MNITEAKDILLTDFLAAIGCEPTGRTTSCVFYLSPLRSERNPSFKVNTTLNKWYDFGLGQGGGIIELGMLYYHTNDVSMVLHRIESDMHHPKPTRQRWNAMSVHRETVMEDVEVKPLTHFALRSYLRSRSIDADTAVNYCHEFWYTVRGKRYFAIAFGNINGGYELRNQFFKGCYKCKDISLYYESGNADKNHICIFEGFMDFLSYMTLRKKGGVPFCVYEPTGYIIMNSVAMLKKCLVLIQDYKHIHCYLDNDLAGCKTVETIVGLYGERVIDESVHYIEYKDLNDYLRGKKR